MRLSKDTIGGLDARIDVPQYDRSLIEPGILHIGIGNFHRAHQAVYLDDLMATGTALDWGILGAGTLPAGGAMRTQLGTQDWLFTVVEQDAKTEHARICGAMTGFVDIEPHHGPLRVAMANPSIRIVSLTITEGGYFLDPAGLPDLDHPALKADIANPNAPTTAFGAIVAGLRHRRTAGLPPFTVMSCDNLPHNGDISRKLVIGIAAAQDKALADWITSEARFPNGMVDRITPVTTPENAAHLSDAFGIEDACPVFCEPFRQWVLEDSFSDGRPALEAVGVEFVTDVTPFETMKIRILNGGHAIIAYAGSLLGLEYAHEAMAHPLVSGFLEKVESEEILPVVPSVPGTSTRAYLETVSKRFANPRVEDTLRRLCLDGSNRQPKFIVPSIRDNLEAGGSVTGLALESALWCRYCMGRDEQGHDIAPNDPIWPELQSRALQACNDPAVWLDMRLVYGDVAQSAAFQAAFAKALEALIADGTAATLQRYIA